MAKKKKATKVETIEQEQKSIANAIGYSGSVKLSVSTGKNKIVISKSHNAGNIYLFKFLAKCLQGNYSEAEAIAPIKIKLFKNNNTYSEVMSDKRKVMDNATEASSFVYYNTTATIEEEAGTTTAIGAYLATLHFKIPFAYIKTSQQTFNQLCLYGKEETSNTNFSAYYCIPNDAGNDWKNINAADYGGNYELIIEWTMRLTNK